MTDARNAARLNAVLEALSFERRLRDARTFEDLFLRFQRRVACETLMRPAGDPHAFDAERFFAEWVEEEMGLAGEERARAFEWLAVNCGFDVTTIAGACRRPWEEDAPRRDEPRLGPGDGGFSSKGKGARAHRVVIATIEGRRILADAAFPLPILLPLDPPAQEIPTGFGALSIARPNGGDEIGVTCDARGEVTELLRFYPPRAAPPLPLEEICRPPPGAGAQHDARRSKTTFALRLLDDRVLFWSAGRMTILDAWSRLEYPLPASERAALEKLFALELGGVALPDETHQTPPAPATLRVFHESPVSADEARGRVARDAPALSLVVGRETRVEESGAGSRITIEASLAPSLPPEGPTEAVRKRLVFHLMSELFELSRG
jgi:hypothetical protein